MQWGRKAGLLLLGLLGSVVTLAFLIENCVQASSASVVARVNQSVPFALENAPLIIEGITGYEGGYVEDETDEEVVDVAALMIRNMGTDMIRQAQITVYCEQDVLQFQLTYLPAGEGQVALELNRKHWIPQQILSCSAIFERADPLASAISIKEMDAGILEIANLTDHPVYDLVLYHKNFTKETGYYFGGISYRTRIDTLQPGQLLLVKPHHYVPGVSKIVWFGNEENCLA